MEQWHLQGLYVVSQAEHRGGKRPGAGRKPLPPGERKVRRMVWLRPRTAAFLDAVRLPDETYGEAIDRLIEVCRPLVAGDC